MERSADGGPGAGTGRRWQALWRRPVARVRRWRDVTATAIRQPGRERDEALLVGKAALATVLAWQFAVRVMDSPSPFYAPLAALLVVDRTLVRSIGASVQRIVAVVLGMLTAWLVGSLVGVHWWSMLPVIALSLFIAKYPRLGDHGIQVPIMVLLCLLTVGGTTADFTYLTIAETLAGGLIGVLTNAVVLPPLHVREPRQQITDLTQQVKDLLGAISAGLREGWSVKDARTWYDTSTDVLQRAPLVHEEIETGRESQKLNPRDALLGLDVDWAGYGATVEAVRRSQWQVSGIARTLLDAADDDERLPAPSQEFLHRYADVLDRVAAALEQFGLADEVQRNAVHRELDAAVAILDDLDEQVRKERYEDPWAWPGYGALLLDAHRLVRELQDHADDAVVPTDSGVIPLPDEHDGWLRRYWPGRRRHARPPNVA